MNVLTDLMLPRPFSHAWFEPLLFGLFLLHLAFVLLMVGTAIMAFVSYLARSAPGSVAPADGGWTVRLLRPFMPFEALAVVLGVGPLLLIQVGYTLSFFSAANVLAPYWVGLIALMVVGFLSFDVLEHRAAVRSPRGLALAVVGLVCLLAIPGVFVAILLLAERPESWVAAIRAQDRLLGVVGWTWLVRYLHVLGAAVVVAAAFHLYWSAGDEAVRRRSLARWLRAGLMAQVLLGAAMYALVFARAAVVTHVVVLTGILAVALVWLLALALGRGEVGARPVLAGVAGLLAVMLLARETLQQSAFAAVTEHGMAAAEAYARTLAPHATAGLAVYERSLATPIRTGDDVYDRSCGFCHGARGDGQADAAHDLRVPPETVRELRLDRAELYRILTSGVPGSAMPAFTFYDRGRLDGLIAALDARFGVLRAADAVPAARVGQGDLAAMQTWAETCAGCHGAEGAPTPFGRRFRPPPPDLTRYAMQPARAFQVITEGYPGTMMVSFAALPEDVRWGLVQVAASMRTAPR